MVYTKQTVELVVYEPDWPQKFEAEKYLLVSIIGEWLYGSVEHVGSTAVPGLVAKPIIDIMFGVKTLEGSIPAIDILQKNGYKYFPYKTEVMHWLCKPGETIRTHHLHLVPYGGQLWKERIMFRNLLRKNSFIANEYAVLKQNLALQYRYDRESYTQAKWPFIQRVLKSCD